MNEYVQNFYMYILPIMALVSFVYIIYLLLVKQAYFEHIKEHFHNAIDENKKLSNQAIKMHFENMQNYTKQALEQLEQDVRKQLQNTLSNFEDINEAQNNLNYQMKEIQRANSMLHDEIKKRDAIIERKTKQIKRLKDAV